MLTIWVHVVPGHLWGGEPLLERVRAVAILIHGDQLLLRGSQWREGVHHPFHPIGHHLCKASGAQQEKSVIKPDKEQNFVLFLTRTLPRDHCSVCYCFKALMCQLAQG